MSWSVAQQVSTMHTLIQGGVSKLGAAALVSRWSNVEDPNGLGSAVNPYSGAFGIAQDLGSRKSALFSFADDNGLDPNDPQTQAAFAAQELNSSEGGALAQLNSASDPYSAATGASMFERAEGYNPATGEDNFTGQTANGIPSILANYDAAGGNAVPDGYVSTSDLNTITGDNAADDAALTAQPGDASIPTSSDLTGQFGLNEEDIQAANYSGAAASLNSQTGGALKNPKVSTSKPGKNLTAAVNQQTKQLATNQKASDATATSIAKTQAATTTGIVANLEAFSSNLFVRGALIVVGVIFILAAVFALAFGGGDLKTAFHNVTRDATVAA